MAIYDQLLATPTQSYQQHFQNFKDFVAANAPQDILSEEEYAEIKEAVKEAPAEETEETAAESEVDVDAKIREKILERRTEVHKKTEEEIVARWPFEEAIKRPYFHVKPLEKGQLKMWKEYLDFEIERGDEKRITILFERCLIACALYEEYWIKYIKYLQSQPEKNIEKLRDVFTRACTIHHPSKPWINLHWAAFEECQGNWDTAAEILEKLEKVIPNALHLYFRRINLERRRGNLDKCVELFEKYASDGNNKTNIGHIKIKYARFVARWLNDYEKAKRVLQESIGDDESTRAKTIMSLIDLALDQNPIDYELIISTFDQALESDLPNEQKVTFAHRKIEFLEDYGAEVESIEKAEEELQSIAKQMRDKKSSSDSRGGDEISKTTTNGAYGPGSSSTTPTSQYSQAGSGAGSQGGSGPGYNQYGQYSNWNYQQSAGYGYNQQGWSAYGGYYG
jgi:pre-mRNA-processing factor 39